MTSCQLHYEIHEPVCSHSTLSRTRLYSQARTLAMGTIVPNSFDRMSFIDGRQWSWGIDEFYSELGLKHIDSKGSVGLLKYGIGLKVILFLY